PFGNPLRSLRFPPFPTEFHGLLEMGIPAKRPDPFLPSGRLRDRPVLDLGPQPGHFNFQGGETSFQTGLRHGISSFLGEFGLYHALRFTQSPALPSPDR